MNTTWEVRQGDCRTLLAAMPSESVHCCVTSPPYFGLRDYGCAGQIGLEPTPDEYVAQLVAVFREVRRVLRDDGTLWLNLGDSYAGSGKGAWDNKDGGQKEVYIPDPDSPQALMPKIPPGLKPKDLIGIPWRVAFALQADGWYLRQDIIWAKPNPMPESVRDRCTKAHEYLFLLAKGERYFYDADAIAEKSAFRVPETRRASGLYSEGAGRNDGGGHRSGGFVTDDTRNRRSVWTVGSEPCREAHFAVMPTKLVEPCIKAGCPQGGTVLDPFTGAGTVGLVAARLGCNFVGTELNPEYAAIARARIHAEAKQARLF